MVAIRDSLSNLTNSDDGEDGEHENVENTEHGKLSEDDKPGWVMGTISKPVPQWMERFRQKQMKLVELTQPGWLDTAEEFPKGDSKCGTSKSMVPAVVKLQTADDEAEPSHTTFVELMECLDIVPGILQMPQWTSRQGSRHFGLGSAKPWSD